MGAVVLLNHVFGRQEGQTTGEFLKEVRPLLTDTVFISECLAYALANNLVPVGTTITPPVS